MTCTPVGIFSGMTTDQLQAALTAAQSAYIALISGSKYETVSYTQGDGAKSVTFTRAKIENLNALIRQLQQALGLVYHARRPIRLQF